MTAPSNVDLFGGSGGLAEACRILGLTEVGLDWDDAACRTRAAAGHPVIRTNVAAYPTAPFRGRITGLIACAPCQAWSRAGQRLGLLDQPLVHQAVADLAKGRDTRAELLAACRDARSLLAAEPMRWLHDLRPEWTVMEEVPDVLPLWQQYAQVLREWGYSAWCGILNAADYGVPQTRRRAILIASRVRATAPPEPTHTERAVAGQIFGPQRSPWVSMTDILGPAVQGRALRNGNQPGAAIRHATEPAPTMTFGHNAARIEWLLPGGDTIRITTVEAATLQSFRPDYPWQGSNTRRFEQIGNAVPPRLGAAVVGAAAGLDWAAAVEREYCTNPTERSVAA